MAYVNKAERVKQELKRLRTQNGLYAAYLPKWKLYMNAIEGGESFANKENLHRHVREHEDDFDERAKRLYYDNILEGLVSFFTDFIFSETILRDGGPDNEWYQNFLKDVDKQGNDIETFMREQSDDMQIFGMIYVVVDMPKITVEPGTIRTKFHDLKEGIRPYWIAVRPEEMLDWVADPFGKFLYAKRQQLVNDYVAGSVRDIERYTEWTPEEIKVTDVDVTNPNQPVIVSTTSIENKLGEVPIQVIRYKKSKANPFMGNSFIRDLVLAAKAILNMSSLENEFLYRQCFNILAMEAETSLPFKEQEEGEEGTANALIYPKGAQPPTYISPSAEPAQYIADTMQRIEHQMYKRSSQDMMNELFNGAKSSGYSKTMSFSKSVPKISSRADILEKAETNLMRLTMKFMGKEWKGSVKYKDRYEITSLTDWLTQLSIVFSDLGLESETFMKTQFKKLSAQFDGKFTTEELQKINAEIEKIDFKKWFKKVGPQEDKPKVSPAAQQKPKSSKTAAQAEQQSTQNSKDTTAATKRVRKSSQKEKLANK